MSHVNPVPEGFSTVSIHMTVKKCSEAIEFYKKAFGAEELARMPGPDGQSVMHGELKVGDSIIMLNDEFPKHHIKSPQTLNGSTFSIHLYVEDADGLFDRAREAGATVVMPPVDMFWGDRFAQVVDPYGHSWSIATHIEDLTTEEIGARAREFFSKSGDCGCNQQ